MRFYTRTHKHYCGIDLHARSMYVCVLDREGTVLVSKNIAAAPKPFLELIAPYREDLAVAAECMFTWYWVADLCERERIVFVLGHALYMRAIHGGKRRTTASMRTRSRRCCVAGCCRRLTCTRRRCGPRGI
jgi:hypothetical protein